MKARSIVLIAAALAAAFLLGYELRERKLFPYGAVTSIKQWIAPRTEDAQVVGRWGKARAPAAGSSHDNSDLSALGYAAGTKVAGTESWVTIHDKSAAFEGFNVFTSGHAPEAVLTDMDGRVLHRWALTFEAVWPGRSSEGGRIDYWRRGHLYENGDFLAMFDNLGLVKVDKDSHLLWATKLRCHHDVEVLPDGRICVLTRELVTRLDLERKVPIWNDAVTFLDANGTQLDSLPILDAFKGSNYASVLSRLPATDDVLHTNTIEVFDGSLEHLSPLFRKGNVLISMRTIDVIAILDMQTRRVGWSMTGMWIGQHDPTLLDNGHLLLFDNLGLDTGSRVMELDPFTQEIAWSYHGDAEHPFFSKFCGTNRRLPNGDVLVTETESGRAFEVTRDGRIVWEFFNPFRAGEHSELIAVIFDLVRLPPDFPIGWASSK